MFGGALFNDIQDGGRPGTACLQVLRSVPAGSVLAADSVKSITCPAKPEQPLFYDARLGASRAGRALVFGEVVQSPPAFAIPAITPGEHLHLRTQVGAVVIEREVEALQAARPNSRLFVRDAEGQVFPVTAGDLQP